MNVKELKDLFNSLPEDRGLDLAVFDQNGSQAAVAEIRQVPAMDVSPVIAIILSDGQFITTVDPRAPAKVSGHGPVPNPFHHDEDSEGK